MNILVTGVRGQLGHDVAAELKLRHHEVIGTDIEEMDITDLSSVTYTLTRLRPDAIIHCAAWTAVDAAQEEENREKVFSINRDGTANIASVCRNLNIKMMYLSTDYVFDGQGTESWKPDCKEYHPLNIYGQSKLEGELAVAELERFFIIRIAWVFGKNGSNFVKTMLKLGKDHDRLRVVNDQIGTPTYTRDLAKLLSDIIETDRYGYYHATNEGGYISWYEFAREIFRQAAALGCEEYDEKHLTVDPVTSSEYGLSKAMRPFNSRLDKSKLSEKGFSSLPDWRDALQRYLRDILSEEYKQTKHSSSFSG